MSARPTVSRGFTMIEVMVAMLLLATTGATILSSFANSTAVVGTPENAAYYLAAQQLAALNEAVRDDWWGNPNQPLSLNNPQPQPGVENIGPWTFTSNYTVNDSSLVAIDSDADGEDYRKVRAVVSWP